MELGANPRAPLSDISRHQSWDQQMPGEGYAVGIAGDPEASPGDFSDLQSGLCAERTQISGARQPTGNARRRGAANYFFGASTPGFRPRQSRLEIRNQEEGARSPADRAFDRGTMAQIPPGTW